MKHFCNPLNLEYTYQVFEKNGSYFANREAADPSLVLFQGKYYLFPSMTYGFFVSEDLLHWEKKYLPESLPLYDYAPDVRVMGEYLYFSASKRNENCDFYRTKDPESGTFEKIPGTFPFWDPNLFMDDDGKIYFYWGCSNSTPIWGCELDPLTMEKIGEPKELIFGHKDVLGYERKGEDHEFELTEAAIEEGMQFMVIHMFPEYTDYHDLPPEKEKILRDFMSNDGPFIEGAWMTKHEGKYYLQYASPATEVNTYSDGVYISNHPLGPFTLAKNNPYSYHPGGFMRGAGHGSTLEDKKGAFWHIASMGINVNHDMERRVGLWPAGFDKDGDLWCDQRFGDWPVSLNHKPWQNPDYMLLSFGKKVTASSGEGSNLLTNEDCKNGWHTDEKQPTLVLDLEKEMSIHGCQINFWDLNRQVDKPKNPTRLEDRHIVTFGESAAFKTRWTLETSLDGQAWSMWEDCSDVLLDLSHPFVESEEGIKARYLRIHVLEVPYGDVCISGIRVFGQAEGKAPAPVQNLKFDKVSDLDILVSWKEAEDTMEGATENTSENTSKRATGYVVNWGYASDKLYHSYMVYGKTSQKIGAVISGQDMYFRVDAFNEYGVTEGKIFQS